MRYLERSGSCISLTVLIEGRYNAVERRSPFVLSAIVSVNFVPCTVKPETRGYFLLFSWFLFFLFSSFFFLSLHRYTVGLDDGSVVSSGWISSCLSLGPGSLNRPWASPRYKMPTNTSSSWFLHLLDHLERSAYFYADKSLEDKTRVI